MQYIEEIAGSLAAIATVIAAFLAAAKKIKSAASKVETDDATTDIVQELSELKVVIARMQADMSGKIPVQIENLQKDVHILFEKTDKLTDILIDHFSK